MTNHDRTKSSFAELCRQNTGRHPMDSGGESGRQWQQPLPESALYVEARNYTNHQGESVPELSGYISLSHFLDANFDIDTDLTNQYHAWLDTNDEMDCQSSFTEFAESVGLVGKEQVGDNSYNSENDLDQNFQFCVWGDSTDWYYDNDAVWYIESHNGADIRGGYSSGVICRPSGDSDYLLEWSVGWTIDEVIEQSDNYRDTDGFIDTEFDCGYSANPTYHLEQQIQSIESVNKSDQTVTVRMIDGALLVIRPIHFGL